jgi:pyridoxamine 5'-phosphate oxidase
MDTSSVDLSNLREEYSQQGLRRKDLDPDPVRQFSLWFTAAVEAGLRDANAMSLATSSREGQPSVRVVLLKGFDTSGFVFFTNYDSEKGRQLDENPRCAVTFWWAEMERQVRICGETERTSREESARYFHSRPRGSQLGAWVSKQSEVIDGRQILEARLAQISERYAQGEVPLPPHWGGYRFKPEQFEFWQGRSNRLHDRFRYTRQGDGTWNIERLAP